MAGVGGGDAGQCEFNWIKVSALHSKVHVCCPPPLIHEANTPSRIPPLTNVILAVEVTLKSIRIRSLDGIVLEKDATATYCCPHCFSSFRRRNSRSQRKKNSRVDQTLHHFTQPSSEKHMTCDANTSGWAHPLHTPPPIISFTESRETLARGRERSRSRGGGWGSVSCAERSLRKKCAVNLTLARRRSASSAPSRRSLQQGGFFALASGSGAASRPPVSAATLSTNEPRRCPCQTFGEGIENVSAVSTLWKKKGGGWTKKNGTKYEDDDAPVCSSLLFSVADCVPAPLTLAVLLNVVRLKSTPLGRDHNTAKPVSGFHTKGSPLFCLFFHNNNNGVREPSDPCSLWGWHVRQRDSPTPSPRSSPSPSYPLWLALPFTERHAIHPLLILRSMWEEMRWWEFNFRGPTFGDNCTIEFFAGFKDHRAARWRSERGHDVYRDTTNGSSQVWHLSSFILSGSFLKETVLVSWSAYAK